MMDRVRAVALGNSPADILLKNGRVVDVLTETIYEADVAIAEGMIAGVGSYDKAEKNHRPAGSICCARSD